MNHEMQAMIDHMQNALQRQRADTQMTLGALIRTLMALPRGRAVVGFGKPHSYRGYYCDLAFEPSDTPQSVAELLATCRGCTGRVFTGYKGGDYVMHGSTPVWIAHYGEGAAPRLMGLDADSDPIRPMLAMEDEGD